MSASTMLVLAAAALAVAGAVTPLPFTTEFVVHLSQADFVNGTYLAFSSKTRYVLQEDIVFNPNSYSGDSWRSSDPHPAQFAKYDPAAFGIGFFAAIAVSGSRIIIDLNGHTLQQSKEHRLQQRFYANIELADQPFIPNQGPHGFGDVLFGASDVAVINGGLGRSSHHGIHGNGNKNVFIQNVDFHDFEVAAIALNGPIGLHIEVVTAVGNAKDVPILGTYSAGRFLRPYVDWLVQTGANVNLTVAGVTKTPLDIRNELHTSLENVFNDLIVNDLASIDSTAHLSEWKLFHNHHGVVDGNCYGILINHIGVAVDAFPTRPQNPARDIVIEDVRVGDIAGFIHEIPALGRPYGSNKAVIDGVGSVFQVFGHVHATHEPLTVSVPALAHGGTPPPAGPSTDGVYAGDGFDWPHAVYTGNVIANAQALVGKAALYGAFASSHLSVARHGFTQLLLDWIEAAADSPDRFLKSYTKDAPVMCNGDSMFHVNKGVIGFKLDASENIVLKNVVADNIRNMGRKGRTVCGYSQTQRSHSLQSVPGYNGAATRGFSFSGTQQVRATANCAVEGVSSYGGSAIGFEVMQSARNIDLSACTAKQITVNSGDAYANADFPTSGPTRLPVATGFRAVPGTWGAMFPLEPAAVSVFAVNGTGSAIPVVDQQTVVFLPSGVQMSQPGAALHFGSVDEDDLLLDAAAAPTVSLGRVPDSKDLVTNADDIVIGGSSLESRLRRIELALGLAPVVTPQGGY